MTKQPPREFTDEIKNRFLAKVNVKKSKKECWEWNSSIQSDGYGSFWFNKSSILAHRFSYILHNGKIGNGIYILHKCDNRKCVNPHHLFQGNNDINMKDMVAKNRHFNGKKTHCKRGHEFTKENTQIDCRGDRACKECMKIRKKEYQLKKKAKELESILEGRDG